MSKFIKHSRTYFILGLLIGLGFGLMFSIYSDNKDKIDNLSSVIFYNNDSITTPKKDTNDNVINKKNTPKKQNTKNYKKKNKTIKSDSLLTDSVSTKTTTDSISNNIIDSLNNDTNCVTYIDSITHSDSSNTSIEDTSVEYNYQNEDMQIAQDELIYSEYIIPQGRKSDFLCKTFGELDSVLTNNIVTHEQEGIYVEFWRSPLNSTGYKLSHNTLVLFGFYQYKAINLKYMKNGRLKVSYLSNTFEITCSDEFVPLQITK